MNTALLFALAWNALSATPPLVLAVGVNEAPSSGMQALMYADDDAAAAVELFGGDSAHTWLLTHPDASSQERFAEVVSRAVPPSLDNIRRAVKQMARILEEQPAGTQQSVVIWLVGHGALDEHGQPYLALAGGRMSPTALDSEILKPLRAAHRVHVIIDACHAESLVRWRAAVLPSTTAEVRQSFGGGPMPNVGYLLAAASGQKTYEWDEMRSGVFSALVRAALRGAADANGDGRISYDEVTAYVTSALQGIPVPDARPTVTSRPPAVEQGALLSRAEWFIHAVGLAADLGEGQLMHVEDERGVWLAGGLFEPGHPATLWLPRRSDLVMRKGDTEWALLLADTRLVPGAEPLGSGSRARGPLERALKEGLFSVPYGPGYWRGYKAAATTRLPEPNPTRLAANPKPNHAGRTLLPLVSAPLWLGSAALGGAALVSGMLAAFHAYEYATTTYQRLSAQSRNLMLATSVASGAFGTLSLVMLGVGAVALGVLVWLS